MAVDGGGGAGGRRGCGWWGGGGGGGGGRGGGGVGGGGEGRRGGGWGREREEGSSAWVDVRWAIGGDGKVGVRGGEMGYWEGWKGRCEVAGDCGRQR